MRNRTKGASLYTRNMVELDIPDVRGRTPIYTRDKLEVRGNPADILEVHEKPTINEVRGRTTRSSECSAGR